MLVVLPFFWSCNCSRPSCIICKRRGARTDPWGTLFFILCSLSPCSSLYLRTFSKQSLPQAFWNINSSKGFHNPIRLRGDEHILNVQCDYHAILVPTILPSLTRDSFPRRVYNEIDAVECGVPLSEPVLPIWETIFNNLPDFRVSNSLWKAYRLYDTMTVGLVVFFLWEVVPASVASSQSGRYIPAGTYYNAIFGIPSSLKLLLMVRASFPYVVLQGPCNYSSSCKILQICLHEYTVDILWQLF